MIIKPVTLFGQHVCLEPLAETHIPELIKAGSNSSIWQYSWPSNQHHTEIMENYIYHMLALHKLEERLHFAVRHLVSNRLIGMTSYYNFQKAHRNLEIGGSWYVIEFQRSAVNTESKYMMLKQAFEVWDCIRVQFRIDAKNLRSTNSIKRIGATKEGVLRNNYIVDGKCYDLNLYSIINREWPEVKLKLELMLAR